MRCIDAVRRVTHGAAVFAAAILGLTSCSTTAPGTVPGTVPGAVHTPSSRPIPSQAPSAAGAVGATVKLPAPNAVRSWDDLRLQAARRLVAAHPNGTYLSRTPDVLLAIPVLEMELNSDGSIKRVSVMRYPGQAPETTQMAIDAVRRAAPFGDVSRLPKPWKFVEVFLFNDERRFKPRTLDN